MKTVKNFICPLCGNKTSIEVDEGKWARYSLGDVNVQDVFAELSPFEREVIISHICFQCQENMFHRPAPGHEDKFGKELGECSECGCAAWECDVKDGKYTCPQCGNEEYISVR